LLPFVDERPLVLAVSMRSLLETYIMSNERKEEIKQKHSCLGLQINLIMIYQVVLSEKKTVSAQLRACLINRVGKIEG
jgi:hypothetical protein